MNWAWLHRYGSPPIFFRIAGRVIPWVSWLARHRRRGRADRRAGARAADYQQGEGYRIIFVHVPSAVLSTVAYGVMAVAAGVGLIWRMKRRPRRGGQLREYWSVVHGPRAGHRQSCGASPMWGTYWEWDPRLTSELVLLFLYLGYMGLRGAIDDTARADRASAVLALVGVVNLPIIHYSVDWWNSLHQGHTLLKFGKASMPASMLVAAAADDAGLFAVLRGHHADARAGEVLRRERNARWIA